MAKDFSKSFYNSTAWQQVSTTYMSSKNYICERCGQPAKICHHKVWLTPINIQDPNISLNTDNLEALCQDCHNIEHTSNRENTLIFFDNNGNITSVKDNETIKERKAAAGSIDDVIERAKALFTVVSSD